MKILMYRYISLDTVWEVLLQRLTQLPIRVKQMYNQDPLVEKEISAGIFNHAAPGLEFMKLHASDFTDPVLILHGGNDQIISEEDSRILFGEIGSSDKTLHIIAKFCHEIFNEIGKDKVIDEVIEWIEDRI